MSCRERELIYLYVAGVLDEGERAELEEHLATGCPRCNAALDEERENLAVIALSLTPVAPPARVREQLIARVREAARAPQPGASRASRALRPRLPRRFAAFAGVALGAAALTLVIAYWQFRGQPAAERAVLAGDVEPRDDAQATAGVELASLREQLADQDDELAELEAQLEAAAEVSKLLGARELDVLDLAASEPGSGAWGRAFWDPDYRCYFRAEGLAPLAPGQRYVLWMVGAGDHVHAAGELEPDADGKVAFTTRLPRELAPVTWSFVTAESTPLGESPKGPTLLASEAPGRR